jgi:hypothetical protein
MWPGQNRVRLTRDTVIVAFAMSGITYEMVISNAERPTFLIGFFGLLTSPFFLHRDEKRIDEAEPKVEPKADD